jgi:hypothetical protein
VSNVLTTNLGGWYVAAHVGVCDNTLGTNQYMTTEYVAGNTPPSPDGQPPPPVSVPAPASVVLLAIGLAILLARSCLVRSRQQVGMASL